MKKKGKNKHHQPFTPEEDDTIIKAHAKFDRSTLPCKLLKRSFSLRVGTNSSSPYGFDLSNLDFSKFPQLCLYPLIAHQVEFCLFQFPSVMYLSVHYHIRWNFAFIKSFTSNASSINISESLFTPDSNLTRIRIE
ncbi:hypothetical protein H5410_063209 [Solanum commersonii]|uniref:Uncharacterized protein n=1 Tax=Solanum commersonii TaxID=4109 RepID=A0A9J5WCL6_SOLCO|nr:hypothetical protein H5410_063209 [Solanum commersonii]